MMTMTKAADLETGMQMAPNPFYPHSMIRIVAVTRTSHIRVKIELADGRIQYLDPRCPVHTTR